ncbi:MAG TPA: hypothetical protein VJH23_04005 [archaeon]|nr:hypothetical protein [archaeon]
MRTARHLAWKRTTGNIGGEGIWHVQPKKQNPIDTRIPKTIKT